MALGTTGLMSTSPVKGCILAISSARPGILLAPAADEMGVHKLVNSALVSLISFWVYSLATRSSPMLVLLRFLRREK